ncbi:MAG: flagellar basal body P-ring protein FlgI [Phycisphaerales bacterium]
MRRRCRDHRPDRIARAGAFALAALAVPLAGERARAQPEVPMVAISEMTRLANHEQSHLWGLGLVIGLNGTGDSGEVPPVARQIAAMLEKGGNPIPDLSEIAEASNIALVHVSATIPENGARVGDTFDVRVSAWHNAASLRGGTLFMTPMLGPTPGSGVWGVAQGDVIIEDASPTSGRVRAGMQMIGDVIPQTLESDGSFSLIIRPEYAGWGTAEELANTINQVRMGAGTMATRIAFALDPRTVHVSVPETDLMNPANFISEVLSVRIDPRLLDQPARVVINERRGTIIVSGDVTISPAVISHAGMTITTVIPDPPAPTPEAPQVSRGPFGAVAAPSNPRSMARLDDLLQALQKLDVPAPDRIEILIRLHKAGLLHGELILE